MTTLTERFWAKVDRSGECWIWTGAVFSSGYGAFNDGDRMVRAHRAALEEELGRPMSSGMVACHRCDVKLCVRSAHLYEGTHAQNMLDRSTRRRVATGDRNGSRRHPESRPRGEGHAEAKLTEADVVAIRSRRQAGERGKDLAKIFGVTPTRISQIVRGKGWTHV